MKVRRGRKALHVAVATALSTGGLVFLAESTVHAGEIVTPPTRVYMAPNGIDLSTLQDFADLAGVAQLAFVPSETLEFDDGTDPISQDVRSITVSTGDGPAPGCVLEDDPDVGDPDYVRGGCSRVVLNVSHGRIFMGNTSTNTFRDNPDGSPNMNDPAFMYPSGAMLDGFGGGDSDTDPNLATGYLQLEILGTEQELNDTLDNLVYMPDDDYHYTGDPGDERLNISLVPADGSGNAQHSVEIRVLDVNEWPDLTGPNADKTAQPEVELVITDEFTIEDTDNDEWVDGDQADPPEPEEPLKDGEYDEMLLIGYLDCGGSPTIDLQTGFHYQGGSFDTTAADLTELVTDYFTDRNLMDDDLAQIADAVQLVLDGLEAIEPGITTIPLSNNQPFEYQSFFVGIADDIRDVIFALEEVTFLHDDPGVTCTLLTIVSDLGNNGLPIQYFGDPPAGFEVPFIGIDWNSFDITTDELEPVDISWDDSIYYVMEGDSIEPTATITPGTHPEFGFRWDATPGTADGPPGGDYGPGQFGNETMAQDQATWTFDDLNALNDTDDEGNEQFTIEITPPTDLPERPEGWEVTSNQSLLTVVILDNDDAAKGVATFTGTDSLEGDPGDNNALTYTLTLDGPADGNESVDVAITGGTSDGADRGAPTPSTVTFAPGQTQATITVPITEDLDDEADDTVTLELSNATNMAPGTNGIAATASILNDDQQRTLSVSDVSINEGDSGTTSFVFTLSLDLPAKGIESVQVDTSDLTANAGSDYVAITGQLVTFAEGELDQTVTVTVNGDISVEPDQTFQLIASSNNNVVLGDPTGIGTIVNDDLMSVVSIADATVSEAAGSSSTTISMTNFVPGRECVVTVTSADGSAQEPGDYSAFMGGIFNLTIASDVLSINAADDDDVEGDETYTLTIALDAGSDPECQLGDSEATITITSDDVASVVSIADATVSEAAGSSSTTISMTNFVPGRECVVTVTSADGSAQEPGDYSAFMGGIFNLTIASDVLSINAADDPDPEGPETYTLTIALDAASDPQCQLGDATATITILDDDSVPIEVSIDDVTVTEGNTPDTVNAMFTISLATPALGGEQITITSADGTATVIDGDYNAFGPATVTFGNGDTGAVASVVVVGDNDDEPDENFFVNLSNAIGLTIADAQGLGTITDDDDPPLDTTAPTVTINQQSLPVPQPDPTSTEPILFTVVFSEPVANFATGDVTLSGTAGATTAVVTGSGDTYTVTVSGMGTSGTVIASILAGVATDAASNPNEASTSTDNTVQYNLPPDTTAPTVTINQQSLPVPQADPTSASPILFTVVFSEPVANFATGDVTLSGTAGATAADVTGSGTTYTVSVSGMGTSGTVIASILAGVATDAASNPNEASTSTDNTVQYIVAPGPLTLTLPANIVRNNDPGQAGAVVSYPAPTASGGVPPTTIVCTPATATFFALGTTTVNCTATDSEPSMETATVTGSFTVTVLDNEPPVIADNPDLTRTTPGSSVVVTFPLPSATDNSGVPPTVVCTPASGASFPLGVSTVTCTATDGAGNSASSSFTITVTTSGGSPPVGGLPPTGSTVAQILVLAALLSALGALLIDLKRRRRI